jgi:putative sterol carrier protein
MTTLETFVGGITAEPQPLLANTRGTLLFELRDGDETRWTLVSVDNGNVGVEAVAGAQDADATVRGERTLIEAIAQGRANAMAAILRGELRVEGDSELLMDFQRIFPGPDDPRQQ